MPPNKGFQPIEIMKSYIVLKTNLVGDLLLTANETHLTGVYFKDCRHALLPSRGGRLDPAHPILRQAGNELQEYLAGDRTTFTVPLLFVGPAFQQGIWREIALVPYGETITYTDLANRANVPDAIRAAGTATGQNPISIIIPCHRIVGKDGKMRGYAGGIERKRALLDLETNLPGLKLLADRNNDTRDEMLKM